MSAEAAGRIYALDETICLMKALRSVGGYVNWLARRMPGLRPDGLLELNELLPEWDEPIHRKLLKVERDRWPRFVRPLVNRITDEISAADRPMVVMDLGAGSMEIERQVICRLLHTKCAGVSFIGLDEAPTAIEHARSNLAGLGAAVELIEADLPEALALCQLPKPGLRVIICQASASSLADITDHSVDLLFHSLMRHHLSSSEQMQLDATASRIAHGVIDYDCYRGGIHLLPLSLLTWQDPAFLAATLFSYVRCPTVRQLKARRGTLSIHRNGCYLNSLGLRALKPAELQTS